MIDPEKYSDMEHSFYTKDGKVLRNLSDLKDELRTMPPHVFDHHVNAEKNDFSRWTKDVFGQESLAAKMERARSRDEMINVLDRNVALAILMAMPRPGKEEVKRAKTVVSRRKTSEKYTIKGSGHSIDSKIKGADLAGKRISYRIQGRYAPSMIEKTAMSESEKLQKVLGKEHELKHREKELDLKEAVIETNIAKHTSHKKMDFVHDIAIGIISLAVVVLLYFAIGKAF